MRGRLRPATSEHARRHRRQVQQSSVVTNIFIHTYITDISVFGTAKGYKKKKINKKRK